MTADSLFTFLNSSCPIGLLPVHSAIMLMHFNKNTPLVSPITTGSRVYTLDFITSVHHSYLGFFVMPDSSSSWISRSTPFARRLTFLANSFSSIVKGDCIFLVFLEESRAKGCSGSRLDIRVTNLRKRNGKRSSPNPNSGWYKQELHGQCLSPRTDRGSLQGFRLHF